MTVNRINLMLQNSRLNTFFAVLKKEWEIQKPTLLEFCVGFLLLLFLWELFQIQYRKICLLEVLSWCFKWQPGLYFSLLFIIIGTIFLLLFTFITSVTEIYIPQKKIAMIFRSLLVLVNCVPIYVFTELWRYYYDYEAAPIFHDYFFYGIAALIFGNAIWLYVHRYFVENIKIELKNAYIETGYAFGFNRIWVIWPKIRLLILDVFRPILLILLGSAIFVEDRFRYQSGDNYEFEGISYLFAYDLNYMPRHDFEMILGIIFSVLLFSELVQLGITRIRYHYDPEARYEK